MIPNYPFFGFPNYLRYVNNNYKGMLPKNSSFAHNPPEFKRNTKINNSSNVNHFSTNEPFSNNVNKTKFNSKPIQKKMYKNAHNFYENFSSEEKPIINVFGINLYFDDILIICLIFFLYNEKVTDYYLFFVLILLLLT